MEGKVLRSTQKTLPVTLTPVEIREAGQEMARASIEVVEVRGRAKVVADGFKAKISELDSLIGHRAGLISTGVEYRPVTCEEVLRDGTVYTFRTDTGEIVSSRPADTQVTIEEEL